MYQKDDIGEKCGVVGVVRKDNSAEVTARRASASLQHRGQESAGLTIKSSDSKKPLKTFIGMGLIPHVLTDQVLEKLGNTTAAISHNRYSTTGNSSLENAQPFTMQHGKYAVSIGHNGNIPQYKELFADLAFPATGTSDTALLAAYLLSIREKYDSWDETLVAVLSKVPAAYSLVIMTEDGVVYATRDNYGIRPLSIGKLDDGWIVASETVALEAVGAQFLREVAPGELVKISSFDTIDSFFFGKVQHKQTDLFEHIYFSRPDSFMNGIRVRSGRIESGKKLGMRMKKKGFKPDIVIPIFDSGYPAAKGVSEALKKPLVEAITTSHYVGRTFIKPGQNNRISAVNGKHSFIPDDVVGKDVVFVDDSAVRLTTSSFIIRGLRNCGARKVFAAFASPPVTNHCDMGIDMKSKSELPASMWEHEGFDVIEKKAAEYIGADGVIYLPMDETAQAFGNRKKEHFYYTPFGGPHPIFDEQKKFPMRKKKMREIPEIVVFISGNGTNLQKIIDEIESKKLHAKISCVISNKEDAKGLDRAKKHGIPTAIFNSKGIMKDAQKRVEFDRALFEQIKKLQPDVIVLAGWMLILGKEFLEKVEAMQIPIINIHPALITSDNASEIMTSRGKIPVIRGAHAIDDAFEKELLVSGISIHQVLARHAYDVGPVIMTEEVRRFKDDTKEMFEKNMHEAEYRILPTALKRVLHVMSNGINICTGEFVW